MARPASEDLLTRIGIADAVDLGLLQLALTHSSSKVPGERQVDNERLEYLGDAVLKLAISQWLYEQDPTLPEGAMSKMRAYVVSDANLARVARGLDLGRYVQLGSSERTSGGHEKQSTLANSFEAVLGALFLSLGFDKTALVVRRLLQGTLGEAQAGRADEDNYKATLQELTQARFHQLPVYEVISEAGPAHARHFTCRVLLAADVLGQGAGTTKKMAEQMAAQQALTRLRAADETLEPPGTDSETATAPAVGT
ncbi:MAG: ribonuclease III [Candidatus Sericytochromatia bacterium]|nr:ribonuclease III [Candidatus Sericytochromatia bacterium]